MKIGFDLDKIFINFPPFVPDEIINRLYKKKSNGTLLYRIPSKLEQLFRLVTHHPLLRQPIKENISFVKDLGKKNNAKYYLISSRFAFLKKRTDEIIKKNGLNLIFDDMFFNFGNLQPHIFKKEIIAKIKLNLFIDDDLPLLLFLAETDSNVKFYWLNKNKTGQLSKNIFAITKLADFLKYI